MKIAICNDHAGCLLKFEVKDYLLDLGVEVITDFGTNTTESCDYADFAHSMAVEIAQGNFDFGVSICGSGNGISMTLNKHQGVRAALCWTPQIAALARQHNDANVISIPARFVTTAEALEMIDIFIDTEFEGGRHQRRVDKMDIAD